MWTARRDLPSGTVLRPATWPAPRSRPRRRARRTPSTTCDRVVGRTLAAPMSRGEPLTAAAHAWRAGCCAATPAPRPCRCASPTRPSSTCCGWATGSASWSPTPTAGTPPRLLVDDVPVVAIPERPTAGLGTGTPGGSWSPRCPLDSASEVAARAATVDSHPGLEPIASSASVTAPGSSGIGKERTMTGFKNFILRGNLVELAVAFIMGLAFAAVVTATFALADGPDRQDRWPAELQRLEPGGFRSASGSTAVISFLILAAVVYFLDREALHDGQGEVLPRRGPRHPRRRRRCSRRSATCWPRAGVRSEPARVRAQPWCGGTCRLQPLVGAARSRVCGLVGVVAGLLGQHVAEDLGQPAAARLALLGGERLSLVGSRCIGVAARRPRRASSASNLGRLARQPVWAAKWSAADPQRAGQRLEPRADHPPADGPDEGSATRRSAASAYPCTRSWRCTGSAPTL